MADSAGAAKPRLPDLVAFDLNYTLVEPGEQFGPAGYERLGREFGLGFDMARWDEVERDLHVRATARKHERAGAHDDGMLTFVVRTYVEGLGGGPPEAVSRAVAAMVRAWQEPRYFSLYGDAIPCLRILRGAGIRLALLTNNIGKHADAVVRHHGLDEYFELILSSAGIGFAKPAPQAFAAMCTRSRLRPEQILVVGDNLENDIRGAARSGCAAILLDRLQRYPSCAGPRIETLAELPAALGLHAPLAR